MKPELMDHFVPACDTVFRECNACFATDPLWQMLGQLLVLSSV
jgi:hypothetical protein